MAGGQKSSGGIEDLSGVLGQVFFRVNGTNRVQNPQPLLKITIWSVVSSVIDQLQVEDAVIYKHSPGSLI